MYLHLLLYICDLMITNYCGGNVMYTIEATRKALIDKFNENGWTELSLTLKTGDRIWITPCAYGQEIHSPEDVEYFLLDSDSIYLCGSDSLDKIAETLNTFSDLKKQDESDKLELQKYYDENIAGHSDEEWKLGHELIRLMYENRKYTWETPLREVAEALAEELSGDVDKFESAMRLVECGSTYSDWYKDVYGHRPRY